jgi:hypothetical protein
MSPDPTPRPAAEPRPEVAEAEWESHTTAGGSRGVPDVQDTPREQAPPPGEAGDPDAPPMAVTPGEEPEADAPAPPPSGSP